MNAKNVLPRIILTAMLLFVPGVRAQVVNDGTTNTLSNVTTNITGDVTVGTNGAFTLLVLSDNALLTNSANGLIGRNTGANSNEVRLLSPSARWRMGGSLFVGSNGALSRLVVSNGAFLEDNNGTVGSRIGGSNNFALVTGGSSLWSNRSELTVGSFGCNNQMIVSNGGWVANQYGYLGRQSGSSNNFALVTGTGSVWSNRFDMYVGFNEHSNRLVIEAGGLVHCDNGYVGDFGSASNNEALVTGPGSLWTNRSFLTIGSQAGRNRLVVSNGAAVRSGTGVMGGSSAVSNQVVVTGAGSVWSNETFLYLGAGSVGNRADVNDGGWLACNDGSVGSGFTANSNTVVLTGGGSGWNNLANLFVGDGGSGNVLIASNGATVLSSNAFIGASTSLGNNNLALLTGAGTLWSNRSRLTVGNFSFGNQVVISNGAIYVGTGTAIGANASASSNSVVIAGAQTRWTNSSIFYVGSNGPGNHLLISDGGLVKSFGGTLGGSATSTNNEAVVTGPGSLWLPSNLLIGSSGDFRHGGNRLVISDGGSVISQFSAIGDNSSNNEVVVTGPGSVWTETDRVFLGYGQGRNRLVITNGGEFFSQGIIVGGDTALSTNNRVLVDGGTLQVTNGTLSPTILGAGVLDIRHGTNVFSAGLIDVDQLLLTNTLGLFEFNGGTLVTRGAFISNNVPFTVGRSGTTPAVWDVRAGVSNHVMTGQQMFLGENASFNQLLVTNGALLNNGLDVLIGQFPGSISNSATISGMGSRWAVDGYIAVGYGGSFNRLVVSNGGWMSSSLTFIGGLSNGSNNQALVTGAGSTWNTLGDLRVGYLGSASQLTVSNNGVAFASNAVYVGFDPASTKNRLTVDGGALQATNAAGTGVLDIRRGTNVLNAGLIEVDRLLLTNTLGVFEFNGGTLSVKSSTVNNGQVFRVGNGVSPATLRLAGAVSQFYLFVGGLIISSNAVFTGNGSFQGALTVQAGGLLSPGTSIGRISSLESPLLQGTTFLEISRSGATTTNDQFIVDGPLTYGGTLIVTNIGPNALASGNHFQLFSAAPYAGSFTTISLPPLAPGLNWTNKLLVNGSIDVIGTPLPKFASITVSGTNVLINGTNGLADAPYTVVTSTNVALPLSNWLSIATNHFGPNGEFSFTNGIAPGTPQRFYQIFIYD